VNPITQALLKQLSDPQLGEFARDWEDLESLVVEIYQQNSVSFEQQQDFYQLRERLRQSYALLHEELDLFWPLTKIRGEPVTADPFITVIGMEAAKGFLGNWDAMRTLPAAREALNHLLIARIERKAG
jgi:hypothetical protein